MEISNSVKKLEHHAFYGCDKLTSVVIPASVEDLAGNAFCGCQNLQNVNVSEDNHTYCSIDGVVYNKDKTTLVMYPAGRTDCIIPNHVTKIGPNAFTSIKLKNVNIPNSVTTIGEYAFYSCSLTSVEIPESVTTIEYRAFADGLKYITMHSEVPPVDMGGFNDVYKSSCVVYVPSTAVDAYKSAGVWSEFKNITGFTDYPDYFAVDGFCYKVLSRDEKTCEVTTGSGKCFGDIVIPANVTYANQTFSIISIGRNAFPCSEELTGVTIPEGITVVKEGAFTQSNNLRNVSLPSGLVTIETQAFEGCSSLESITIPETVTQIRDLAFCGCSSLKELILPHAPVDLWPLSFAHSGLERVDLPNEITRVSEGAFAECEKLKESIYNDHLFVKVKGKAQGEFYVPEGIKTISSGAFAGSAITKIHFNKQLERIGYGVFADCNKLEEIILPPCVKNIGPMMFANCYNLQSVTILAENLASIGECAFSCCNKLTSMRLSSAVPANFDYDPFSYSEAPAYSNCTVYIPKGSIDAYKSADGWKNFKNFIEYNVSFNIEDASEYARTTEKQNSDITYTRTFNSTNWQPLYIPFNMSYEEWSEKADVAEIRGIYAYDDNEGVEHTVLAFHKLNGGELKPNTPYVIKPKETGELTFSCADKTLKAAENGSVWCASTRKKYTLTGIYEEKTDMDGVYAMSGGTFYLGDSSSPALSPFRFYLTVEDIDNGYGSSSAHNAPARIQIMVDGETTGIETVATSSEAASCYDLSGRRVMRPSKGIYVQGGKKVLIK